MSTQPQEGHAGNQSDPMNFTKHSDSNKKIWSQKQISTSCQEDINYAIEINLWLLKFLGLSPLNQDSVYFDRFLNYLIMLADWFFLAFLIIPGGALLYIASVDVKMKLIGRLSFCLMAILKYMSLTSKRQTIHDCIEHIIADWQNVSGNINERDIMTHKAQYGRYGAAICALLTYSAAIFFSTILPNIIGTVKDANNVTIRILAYPGYYRFFDPQSSPTFEIIFSLHCGCAFIIHTLAAAPCSIAAIFVMHACGQLEVVMYWLNDLNNDELEHQGTRGQVAKIVRHHVRTLSFIKKIDEVLCNVCLVEVTGCTFGICSLIYDLLKLWGHSDALSIITYSIILISYIINIFVFCYIGEFLTEKCAQVGEMTYMAEWYLSYKEKAHGLVLIILTAQHPAILTAGKFVDLSLNNFSAVIRTAVAYLNFLLTLIN